jgi:hypothetical protein
MVEMNSKIGSVKRPPVAEILSGSDYLVPGFERHARSPISDDGSAPYWRRALAPHVAWVKIPHFQGEAPTAVIWEDPGL